MNQLKSEMAKSKELGWNNQRWSQIKIQRKDTQIGGESEIMSEFHY